MLSLGMSALGSALTGFSSVPLDVTFARFGLAGLDRGSISLSVRDIVWTSELLIKGGSHPKLRDNRSHTSSPLERGETNKQQ